MLNVLHKNLKVILFAQKKKKKKLRQKAKKQKNFKAIPQHTITW